ncbi:MAG TPA: nitroreductase family protein [Candidatus Omnitrophota bacterium]|nr:nitroreductase family protein [Candidatus Omnitrophota bacterium]
MPDILAVIKKRRSIRKFKLNAVPLAAIKKILEAGRWAPSGLNNQPWRYLIIKDQDTKNSLSAFTKYGSIIRNAPVIIAVMMDTADSYNREKDLMAIGASIQNMLLEAESLKVGTCWLGEILNKKKEVKEFLRLDSDLELMAMIAAGTPAHKPRGCRKKMEELLI